MEVRVEWKDGMALLGHRRYPSTNVRTLTTR